MKKKIIFFSIPFIFAVQSCLQEAKPKSINNAIDLFLHDPSCTEFTIGDTLIRKNKFYSKDALIFDMRTPKDDGFLIELNHAMNLKGEYVDSALDYNGRAKIGKLIFNKNCLTCHSSLEWRKEPIIFTNGKLNLGDLEAFKKDKPKIFITKSKKQFVYSSLKYNHEDYYIIGAAQRDCLEKYIEYMSDTI